MSDIAQVTEKTSEIATIKVEHHRGLGVAFYGVPVEEGTPYLELRTMASAWEQEKGYAQVSTFVARELGANFAISLPPEPGETLTPWELKMYAEVQERFKGSPEWIWYHGPHSGMSSRFMFSVFKGNLDLAKGDGTPSYPHDNQDFKRCLSLLDTVPEWRERLDEVSRVGLQQGQAMWPALIEAWSELEAEVMAGRSIYKRINELRRLADDT